MTTAYCITCRAKHEVKDGREVVKKVRMLKGFCFKCGGKVAKILGKAKGSRKSRKSKSRRSKHSRSGKHRSLKSKSRKSHKTRRSHCSKASK